MPEKTFNLENIQGHGQKPDEELLPESSGNVFMSINVAIVRLTISILDKVEQNVDENLLAMMLSMGLPESHCRAGLLATGNNSAELALAWCFENPEQASTG